MGSTQQFCLKWNNHQSNMLSIFDQLLTSEHFVDVTLACDGLSVRAHKMVLSACSPFFQSLFIQNPCEHPIVILKDIRFVDLKALVQFMYRGEVNVSQDQLPTLLKAAETLKIKGLAEVTNETGQKSTVGGSLGVSHNGHHSSSGGVTKTEQPSVQAAPSTLSSTPAAIPSNATTHSLVAAMQQNALKAQLAAAAQVAQAAAAAAAVQNAHESRQSVVSAASHESNSNASTPLRQTDSPMSQQMRKRRRKSAGSDKGSGDENSGPESGAEDNLEETRASDDESAGEEAEFEPSKLLEQSMTEVRQGHQDNNSSSSDNHTKDSNQADMKPVINFDTATGGNALALNPTDPSAVLAFAAAAQAAQAAGAAAASATPGDSVAGPSQPTHGQTEGGGLLIYCTDASKIVPSKLIVRLDQTGDFNFQCSLCGILFKRRKQAQEHSYKHSDKFPYECHFCNYGTVRSYNLKRHCERLHSTPRASQKPELRKCATQPNTPEANDSGARTACGLPMSSRSEHRTEQEVVRISPGEPIQNGSPDSKLGEPTRPHYGNSGSPADTILETEVVDSGIHLETFQNSAQSGLTPSNDASVISDPSNGEDTQDYDGGNDSDCLMIEEAVTDVEDMQ